MDFEISEIANLLKDNMSDIIKGIMKLSLTTKFIQTFHNLYDENILDNVPMTSSFHIASGNNKMELIRDLQIICEIFQKTITLKLLPDGDNENISVDLSFFKSLKFLELQKVKANYVSGIQKLRSQLQNVICYHGVENLEDILEKCGLDNSGGYIWSELKEICFSHNNLHSIDDSLEYSPWLHTVDLSHNNLKCGDPLSCLSNLKHLTLGYNKLERVPHFNGLICNRLQTLILKNNFIEDIEGLSSLVSLYELDLSENCLVDHKILASLSPLASLQMLNLQGNPLSFHPQHRNRTCAYLHRNTRTIRFVLDQIALSATEKTFIGSLYPVSQRPPQINNASLTESISLASDKVRRVRNVTIQEDETVTDSPSRSPNTFVAHLETKKQIEQLREQYGTSWLNQQSGLIVQDVLGLEKSSAMLSSTPLSDVDAIMGDNKTVDSTAFITAEEKEISEINTEADGKTEEKNTDNTNSDNSSYYSEDENLDEGEECFYFATLESSNQEMLLVITETHISERDSTTSKQTARWHINTVVSCKIIDEDFTKIQLDFDTLRRDRQKRIYKLDADEAKRLLTALKGKMDVYKSEKKLTLYQCMKCSYKFSKENIGLHTSETFACPTCESNLIIECS